MKTSSSSDDAAVRRIGICVDDYGMHEGIDSAAIALAISGIASAIGCMTGRASWQQSAIRLREITPSKIDVGLHLHIVSRPDGHAHDESEEPLHRLHLSSYLRLLDADDIRQQIRLQFDEFEHYMQRLPNYVDGHRHVHQLPVVRDLLLEEIGARYGSRGPWIRSTRASSLSPKALLIRGLGGAKLDASARAQGLRTSAGLLGIYNFDATPEKYWANLKGWMKGSRDGDILMCHPAHWVTSEVAHGQARTVEFEVLQSRRFAGLLERLAIRVEAPSRFL